MAKHHIKARCLATAKSLTRDEQLDLALELLDGLMPLNKAEVEKMGKHGAKWEKAMESERGEK